MILPPLPKFNDVKSFRLSETVIVVALYGGEYLVIKFHWNTHSWKQLWLDENFFYISLKKTFANGGHFGCALVRMMTSSVTWLFLEKKKPKSNAE